MPSQPVTFPCPFCGRRMGVPAELLGKQVRCPHCKQVVLAPVTAGPAPGAPIPVAPPTAPPPPQQPAPVPVPQPIFVASPPPAPAPVPAPLPSPPPAPEPELPVLNIPQRKEGADSILSEPDESEDEVFGSHPGARLPTIPRDQPPPTAPPSTPTAPPNPLGDLEPVSLPDALKPAPQPAPAPLPQPVAAPQPAPAPVPMPLPAPVTVPVEPAPAPAGGNPFADFDAATAAPSAPAPRSTKTEDRSDDEERPRKKKDRDRDRERDEPERKEKPAYAQRGRDAAAGGGTNMIVLIALGGWALIATALAVYGLVFNSGPKLETGHPLSTVPDNFGEFPPAERKKVSAYKFPVDGELPPEQRATFGGRITVGQLEIFPMEVKKRTLTVLTEPTAGKTREETTPFALVLRLSIKNTSDVNIFPMDPAFVRRANPVAGDEPITRLVLNKQKYYSGGYISWPLGESVKKKYEKQQANDYVPLAPGETREYVVFTDPTNKDVVRNALAAKEPLQWRVQVRRAPIEFRGKELPVTAIVGVDFSSSDIKED